MHKGYGQKVLSVVYYSCPDWGTFVVQCTRRRRMAARVRGSCNKEQEIRTHLTQVLGEAKNIVLTVARKGANFIVELKTTGERMPIPAVIMQLVSETIASLVKKLKLNLCKHCSDGFSATYRLASS